MALLWGTVRYEDEDPVTYRTEREKALLERVKYECGITIREIVDMLHIYDSEINVSLANQSVVPCPDSSKSLREALEEAEQDALKCAELLDGDCSISELINVLRNTIEWLKFWSVRATSSEAREAFGRQLADREQGLIELMAQALRRNRSDVFRKLEQLRNDGGE
jgi:hypothetical protein